MNLQQLRYVVATAERGTMTAAAECLYVAQPALSRAIRGLERELSVTIFTRHPRGLQLTDNGRDLVELARRVMAQVEQIARIGETAALPVCATRNQAHELGARAAARQVNNHPGRMQLQVVDDRDEVFDAVRNCTARLGLVDLPAPPDLQAVPFGWQELFLVHPTDWELDSPIHVHDLDGIPLLFWPPGNWRRDLLDTMCRQAGIEPWVPVETSDREVLARAVVEGAGATIAFGPQGSARDAAVRSASFSPPVFRSVGAVSLSPPTGDAAAFVEILRKEAESILVDDNDPRLAEALLLSGSVWEDG